MVEADSEAFVIIQVSASVSVAADDFDERMRQDFARVIAGRVGVPTSSVMIEMEKNDGGRFIFCFHLREHT